MRTTFKKLQTLRRDEWWLLVRAQWALLRGQLVVWTRSRGRLIAPPTPPTTTPTTTTAGAVEGPPAHSEAVRIGRALELAVARAARYGLLRPTCLVRSLALQQMLRSRGYFDARVQVGVRFRAGRFQAHAWVEHRGVVLGDGPITADQFERLAQVNTESPV